MKFKWIFKDNIYGKDTSERNYSIGSTIVGLQLQGERPHTVELTYDELAYLLNRGNEKYSFMVLTTMKN